MINWKRIIRSDWTVTILGGLFVTIVGGIFLYYFLPEKQNDTTTVLSQEAPTVPSQQVGENSISVFDFTWATSSDAGLYFHEKKARADLTRQFNLATSSIKIQKILSQATSFRTTIEKQSFTDKYIGAHVYSVGWFRDVMKLDGGGLAVVLEIYGIGTDASGFEGSARIRCNFVPDKNVEQQILLLKSQERVVFSGIFTGSSESVPQGLLTQESWVLSDCVVLSDNVTND